MKFVHIADIHFDTPFVNLSDKEEFGNIRRLEQRRAFKDVIEYIKQENIDNLFIAGDMYENQYIRESTIEYINNLFKEIPQTQIYIAPGNHDPITINSYYKKFNWNENVHIFTNEIQKIETPEANIYGYGFDDFYSESINLDNVYLNPEKLNILVIHATLDGSDLAEKLYNPISSKKFEDKGFDYVALGHIHKKNYINQENKKIIYPGSLVSLGFDELGEHGMTVGNIEKEKIEIKFIPIKQKQFIEKKLDITDVISIEDLIEKINNINENDNFLKINLIGKRNFEINTNNIYKLISNDSVIKIKDNTQINYDLKKMCNENTLTGIFIKKMMSKLNDPNITEDEKNIIEKSIEIGLDALK